MGHPVDAARIKYNMEHLQKNLDVIDGILASQKYMAGEEYSLVDINYMPLIQILALTVESDLVWSRPNLARWWTEVNSRPAWRSVVGPLNAAYSKFAKKDP